jgi:DNA repair photolyase
MKTRGTAINPALRFAPTHVETEDDGWWQEEETISVVTEVRNETVKSIIASNDSPDVPFDTSINPYRGCEHGCIYCFARPSHAYWDLSPGLDFETRLIAKTNAAEVLPHELGKRGYQPSPIALGSNTDPYQPIERSHRITRQILEVLQETRHPFTIVTKGSLILRDLDILADMASQNLCAVMISITTLDNDLKRIMEPRTAAPAKRLKVIQELKSAGVPVGVLASPMIPSINDAELEAILAASAAAGATKAAYMLVRLPHEVAPLFELWLQNHFPLRAKHVMNLICGMRGGRHNDPRFGTRMTGEGAYAKLLQQRFRLACDKLDLNQRDNSRPLNETLFRPPGSDGQLALF